MAEEGRIIVQTVQGVTLVTFEDDSILDPLQVQDIGQKLHSLVADKNCQQVILDFQKVKILSSQMLGVLIGMLKRVTSSKGRTAARSGGMESAGRLPGAVGWPSS